MANVSNRILVEVDRRESGGTNACRRIRAAGLVPGNVYGMKVEPFKVSVNPRRVEEVLRLETGRNTIFNLSLDGGTQSREVMIRELQRHPVTERLVHVDFLRVDPTREVHVNVPVHLIGLAEGVKNEGGILDHVSRQVTIACLPANIPEHFDVDVSSLHVGQHVAVKDLTAGEGVRFLDDPETILATVSMARAEVSATETTEAAEGEAAETPEGTEAEGAAAEGEE